MRAVCFFASYAVLLSSCCIATAVAKTLSLQDIRSLDHDIVQIASDDSNVFLRCIEALQRVAPDFRAAYDVDLIRANRWRLLIDQSQQFGQIQHSYITWDVVVSTEKGDEKQNALESLIVHCGRKLHESHAYQIGDATPLSDLRNLSAPMARAVETVCLCFEFASVTTEWDIYESIEKRFAQILAEADSFERQALAVRTIRLLSTMPIVRTNAVADRIHCRRIGQLAMSLAQNEFVDPCIAVVYHLADVSSHCKAAGRRIQTLDEGTLAGYRVGSYDVSGSFHENSHVNKREMLSAHYIDTAQMVQSFVLAHAAEFAEQFSYPVLEAFARDIARHLGISERDEFLHILDSFDSRMSWKKGILNEYLQRKSARENRTDLIPPVSTSPNETWLEPYPDTSIIQADLNRYHLNAGVFVQSIHSRTDESVTTNRLSYLLFAPKHVNGKAPLVLFIPGSGELGPNLARQFHQRTIFSKLTSSEFQKKHPCYLLVIAPPEDAPDLCGHLADWTPGPYQRMYLDAFALIVKNCRAPEVDMNRIYATGLSSGGRSVYGLSFVAPRLFAAAIPVSSGVFSPEDVRTERPGNWFHLYNDGDYRRHPESILRLDAFSERVRMLGGDFRIGTYPAEGHNAWDNAWREDSVWDWLFSKTLDGQLSKHGNHSSIVLPIQQCSASKPGLDARRNPERATDGLEGTAYISSAPMSSGDWWQCEFSSPFQGKLRVLTGLQDGTGKLSRGHVEVSSDGRLWVRTASFSTKTGEAVFSLQFPVRFLRVLPEPRSPEALILREIKPE